MKDALAILAVGDFDPILMAPEQSSRVTAALHALNALADAPKLFAPSNDNMISAHDDFWPQADSWMAAYKPYIVKAGVLQIPVKGMLLHNFPYAVGTYATGYYYIQKALERGLADPDVKGIALVCDSPGGHVAGCFELCDKIYEARSVKPIRAFAHEHAFSAAYAIFSSASHGTVSRTGGVGSIGVVTMHVNYAKMMEQAGIEVTFIFAGKHKVDGNPYEALSDGAKARIQTRIDESMTVFVKTVARNRGLSEKAVRATEALTYGSSAAVEEGLADKVGPLDEAMAEFSACCMGQTGETKMSTEASKPALDQAAVDAAVATAVTAERARVSGIKALAESKDRPSATAYAEKAGMSVEAAKDFLASMPVEKQAEAAAPAAAANSGTPDFKAAMDTQQAGPGSQANDGKDKVLTQDEKDAATTARILGNAFGEKPQAASTKH